ncbi:MAG: DUF1643 domain-containing protein [Phycisphaeraceae bacterium]|nr:DUF1643 domain-containing protein [Phycisphaeraceae bacterium]
MTSAPEKARCESGPAGFSRDRVYRYWLVRRWADSGGEVNFVLLNPSTADELRLDPTLRRCMGFARAWGFGGMVITNIFALRSTDPTGLRDTDDPVGPDNNEHLAERASLADLVVAGWGRHGALLERGRAVADLLRRVMGKRGVRCLGLTAAGDPKHPLYLPASLKPVPFTAAARTARPARRR